MLNSDYARLRILDAAYDLFGKIGYAATTVRMIAKQADVSLSAIPYHFESKDKLFQNVVELASNEFAEYFLSISGEINAFLEQPQRDPATARALLRKLANKHIDYVFDPANDKQMRLFFQIRSSQDSPQLLGDLLNETTTRMFNRLLQIIRPEFDADTSIILTYSLIGEQLFFFYHRPSVLRQLNLSAFDAESIDKIRKVLLNKLEMIVSA